jgi:transposase
MKKPMKESMNAVSTFETAAVVERTPSPLQGIAALVPPADPEVAATAKRRQFSSSEKRRILVAADRCTAVGEIGALLRREGIYSSHLTTWRKQRAAKERAALEPQKRGRKANPAIAEARRMAVLTQENGRLRHQLAQAHTIIDVQKKLCTLLGLPTAESPDGSF